MRRALISLTGTTAAQRLHIKNKELVREREQQSEEKKPACLVENRKPKDYG